MIAHVFCHMQVVMFSCSLLLDKFVNNSVTRYDLDLVFKMLVKNQNYFLIMYMYDLTN